MYLEATDGKREGPPYSFMRLFAKIWLEEIFEPLHNEFSEIFTEKCDSFCKKVLGAGQALQQRFKKGKDLKFEGICLR